MKATNLETSKKLKEIGMSQAVTHNDYCYVLERGQGFLMNGSALMSLNQHNPNVQYVKAYDLETILEALPKNGLYIDYGIHGKQCLIMLAQFSVAQQKNESLATTAARLLIKLVEENIIKLGE